MIIIPAVDIMGGKCVRLLRGDPKKNKIYYDDPLEAAQLLEKQGYKILPKAINIFYRIRTLYVKNVP